MSAPFCYIVHRATSEGTCACGKKFDDELALDTHILGPELAMKAHRDRMEALKVIHPCVPADDTEEVS